MSVITAVRDLFAGSPPPTAERSADIMPALAPPPAPKAPEPRVSIQGRRRGKRSVHYAGDWNAHKGGFGGDQTFGFFGAKAGSLVQNWPFTNSTIDHFLYSALEALRARSRELMRQSSHAKKYLRLITKGLVGPTGFGLQMRVMRGVGGESQLDSAANQAIEDAWADWSGNREHCDFLHRENWVAIQRMAVQTWAIDGEALYEIMEGPAAGKWGFQLKAIDPEFLDRRLNGHTQGGGQIRLGIEYDASGRRTFYHFRQQSQDAVYGGSYYYGGGQTYKVAAEKIIHVFRPDFVDQSRGYPLLHASMLDLKQMDELTTSGLGKARVSANATGIIRSETEDRYEGEEEGYDDEDSFTISEPGQILDIGAKQFSAFDSNFPDAMYDQFSKNIQRKVAAGLDTSYAQLTGDLKEVNFSSIRAGLLEDRDTYAELQAFWIDGFVRPIFERWLKMALMSGQIKISGRSLSRPFEHYNKPEFQGRRWSYVNPQQDARAAEILLANGLTSRSRIARERGDDFAMIVDDLVREKDMMEQAGLDSSLPGKGGDLVPEDEDDPPAGDSKKPADTKK